MSININCNKNLFLGEDKILVSETKPIKNNIKTIIEKNKKLSKKYTNRNYQVNSAGQRY